MSLAILALANCALTLVVCVQYRALLVAREEAQRNQDARARLAIHLEQMVEFVETIHAEDSDGIETRYVSELDIN